MKIIYRAEAKSKNLTRYYTGKQCKRNHRSERRTCSAVCIDCEKESHLINYQGELRETKIKRALKWSSENVQRSNDIKDNWAKNNPVKKALSLRKTYDKRNIRRKEQRINGDADFISTEAMSGMVKRTLKLIGKKKTLKTCPTLGYTSRELREHIESKFLDGMNWCNHGEWHIDHIIPVSILLEYEVTEPSIINALSNLQPLWAFDNLSKGNRYVG